MCIAGERLRFEDVVSATLLRLKGGPADQRCSAEDAVVL